MSVGNDLNGISDSSSVWTDEGLEQLLKVDRSFAMTDLLGRFLASILEISGMRVHNWLGGKNQEMESTIQKLTWAAQVYYPPA